MPKQFLPLGTQGRPVLMHTADAFMAAGIPVDNIRLVLSADMMPLWRELCEAHGFPTVPTVHGGRTRFHSVRNAVDDIAAHDDTCVLVHDGARPLVTPALIVSVADTVARWRTAVPVVPVTDSLRRVTGGDGVSQSVDRSDFRAVQTPQGFAFGLLREAYRAEFDPRFTDDASVVEAAGYEVHLVDGDENNLKITTPRDLAIAATLLNRRK